MTFMVLKTDPETTARRGRITTRHGTVETPVFMPCGTQATVKALTPDELMGMGAELVLCNTYHLYLRPGHRLIEELGGLHRFMAWPRTILTDSGGYQVYSLSSLRRVSDDGVTFRSHLDGSSHFLSPELTIEIQKALGADIIMPLDECAPHPSTDGYLHRSVEMTLRWAERSRAAHTDGQPALFGIVQGGIDKDLRARAAERLQEIGFDGYALGGLSVGEPRQAMYEVVGHTTPLLPADRPRYLMGVGTPEDLVEAVARGIDMLDCVMPTRHGRTGSLFTSEGRMNIKGAQYARDEQPPDPACECYTCRHFSRAYLRHLFVADEMLGLRLNTLHNLHFYFTLMRRIRHAIEHGTFADLRAAVLQRPVAHGSGQHQGTRDPRATPGALSIVNRPLSKEHDRWD
jgi:queuine tRNA-ribosyltransferase